MLEKIKSSFSEHRKEWLIIFAILITKSIADYYTGVNFYDKDVMLCFWGPLQILLYAFVAIQFIKIKKSNLMWILYFALFYIQEVICFSLVNRDLPIHFAGVSRQTIDSRVLIDFLVTRTGIFCILGYIIARVNQVNEQMREKQLQKKAAKAVQKAN